MKLSHVVLSTLICFSLITPHKAKAVSPLEIAQIATGFSQVATGLFGAYATIELSTIIYRALKTPKKDHVIHMVLTPEKALILLLAGAIATGTCLVSGYQNL